MDLKTNSSILERREVAEKTQELSFKRPADYKFETGQYAQVIIPELLHPDQRGASRLFSIASSPTNKERITIAFRDSGSGYKRTLIEAPIGWRVIVNGPFGKDFALPKDAGQPVVFIAGGIGITPFLAMSHFAAEKKLSLPILLLYANRDKKSAAYLKELDEIAKLNPNFTLKNKFSLIDKSFIEQSVKDVLNALWYIAGPPAMVEESKSILFKLGVDKERIHTERFSGY